MHSTYCLCRKQKAQFKQIIDFENTKLKQYLGIIIAKCTNCGILKTFSTNKLFDPQQSRGEWYEENKNLLVQQFQPIIRIIEQYKPSGTVLDVGCSSGLLLEILKDKGYDVFGLEPNKDAFKVAEQKFELKIKNETLAQFTKSSKKQFNVIIYNHVLEHIEDVNKELTLAKNLLKKNGLLIVGIPNTRNIIFKLRGAYWESLMPLEHIWHFSDRYMEKLLENNGFKILKKSYSNHSRSDYPLFKRIYFKFLILINKFFSTGEAVLIAGQSV